MMNLMTELSFDWLASVQEVLPAVGALPHACLLLIFTGILSKTIAGQMPAGTTVVMMHTGESVGAQILK